MGDLVTRHSLKDNAKPSETYREQNVRAIKNFRCDPVWSISEEIKTLLKFFSTKNQHKYFFFFFAKTADLSQNTLKQRKLSPLLIRSNRWRARPIQPPKIDFIVSREKNEVREKAGATGPLHTSTWPSSVEMLPAAYLRRISSWNGRKRGARRIEERREKVKEEGRERCERERESERMTVFPNPAFPFQLRLFQTSLPSSFSPFFMNLMPTSVANKCRFCWARSDRQMLWLVRISDAESRRPVI